MRALSSANVSPVPKSPATAARKVRVLEVGRLIKSPGRAAVLLIKSRRGAGHPARVAGWEARDIAGCSYAFLAVAVLLGCSYALLAVAGLAVQ